MYNLHEDPDFRKLLRLAAFEDIADADVSLTPEFFMKMENLPGDVPLREVSQLVRGLGVLHKLKTERLSERFQQFFEDLTMARKDPSEITLEGYVDPGHASYIIDDPCNTTGSNDNHKTVDHQRDNDVVLVHPNDPLKHNNDVIKVADSDSQSQFKNAHPFFFSFSGQEEGDPEDYDIDDGDDAPLPLLNLESEDAAQIPNSNDMPSPKFNVENSSAESFLQSIITEKATRFEELMSGQDSSLIAPLFYEATVMAANGKITMFQNEFGEVFVSR